MDIPAETCDGGLGAARPPTIDIASRYITADTPEVVISQGTTPSQEITTSFPVENTQTTPLHTYIALTASHRSGNKRALSGTRVPGCVTCTRVTGIETGTLVPGTRSEYHS